MASGAEFSAWFDTETDEQPNPEHGAVTINAERLAFEGNSGEITLPLSAIKDIRVNHIPPELGPIPPGQVPITIVPEETDGVSAATVAAEGETIRSFTMHVLETRLDGEPMRVRHPAQLGNESTSASFEQGSLTLTDGVIHFNTEQGGTLDVSNVTSFERVQSSGERQHLVRVAYVRQGQRAKTDVQLADERLVSILGRYLHLQTQLHSS